MSNEKLKHTPGPWEITGAYNHLISTTIQTEGRKNDWTSIIGEMWSVPWVNKEKVDIERQANARLVAAAPEMLDLLIDLFKNYECGNEVDKKLSAIIEKATGNIFI